MTRRRLRRIYSDDDLGESTRLILIGILNQSLTLKDPMISDDVDEVG
jgi:hypothetical protein